MVVEPTTVTHVHSHMTCQLRTGEVRTKLERFRLPYSANSVQVRSLALAPTGTNQNSHIHILRPSHQAITLLRDSESSAQAALHMPTSAQIETPSL